MSWNGFVFTNYQFSVFLYYPYYDAATAAAPTTDSMHSVMTLSTAELANNPPQNQGCCIHDAD